MNKFSTGRRRLVFAAVLSTLLLSATLVTPSRVDSRPAYRVYYAKEIIYYSDASHSQEVGVGYIYCNGTSTLDGTSTPYRTEQIIDVCCGSVPC